MAKFFIVVHDGIYEQNYTPYKSIAISLLVAEVPVFPNRHSDVELEFRPAGGPDTAPLLAGLHDGAARKDDITLSRCSYQKRKVRKPRRHGR